MPPNCPPNVGTENIRAWSGAFLAAFAVKFSLRLGEVTLTGADWAFERGTYTITLMPATGGAPVHDAGKYITIYQRHAGDTWVIAGDIWNSNTPLPPYGHPGRDRLRTPIHGRVFSDQPVDGLAKQIGVPGVPAVLLDQVAQQSAQAGPAAVRPRQVDRLVQPAGSQRRGQLRAGARDGIAPQFIQLTRAVFDGRMPLPVRIGLHVGGIPRRTERLASQLGGEVVILDQGQMLQKPAECHRRRADAGLQSGGVQAASLPPERRTQAVQRADKLLRLGAGDRRFPRCDSHGRNLPEDLGVAASTEPRPVSGA
jgi:hypothetical protein